MISWLCRFPFFPYCSPDALYFMRCTALYTSFEKIFNQDVEFTITVTLTCIHHIVYVIANNVCHNIIIMHKCTPQIRAPGARCGCRSGMAAHLLCLFIYCRSRTSCRKRSFLYHFKLIRKLPPGRYVKL